MDEHWIVWWILDLPKGDLPKIRCSVLRQGLLVVYRKKLAGGWTSRGVVESRNSHDMFFLSYNYIHNYTNQQISKINKSIHVIIVIYIHYIYIHRMYIYIYTILYNRWFLPYKYVHLTKFRRSHSIHLFQRFIQLLGHLRYVPVPRGHSLRSRRPRRWREGRRRCWLCQRHGGWGADGAAAATGMARTVHTVLEVSARSGDLGKE